MDSEMMLRLNRLERAIDPASNKDWVRLDRLMAQCRRRVMSGKPPLNAVNVYWAYIRLADDNDELGLTESAASIRDLGMEHYLRLGGPQIPIDHPIVSWALEQRITKAIKSYDEMD